MTEPLVNSRQLSMQEQQNTPAFPRLYLSSAKEEWQGLVAQAFHEPIELEGWMADPTPDISLILFNGGTMRMEQRHAHGPWKTQYLRQGDMILRPGGGTPYEVRWKGLSNKPMQTLHLHLSRDLFSRITEEVTDYNSTRLSLIGHSSSFQDPLLMQICFALWRELEEHSPIGKLYGQTAAQMLAIHLLRYYTSMHEAIKEPFQGLTHQQIRRVTDLVQAHLDQDLSLEMLAQQAGFSPYYFARLFRQTMGESPHQFVLRQRIEHAQHLLKKKDIPLAHIAIESGFANQSHFTQVFKRYLGLTPHAYRQNCSI